MAEPQEQHDGIPTPPEKKPPAKAVKKSAKPVANKTAAKKPPAKKAPAKKAPAKASPATKFPLDTQHRIGTNGEVAAAAKDAAAQAKSTVERANNPVSPDAATNTPANSPAPLLVALMLSLLSILLIRQMRRPR